MSTSMFDPFDIEIPFSGQREALPVHVVNLKKALPDPPPARLITKTAKSLVGYLNDEVDAEKIAALELEDCTTIAAALPEPEATKISDAVGAALKKSVAGESELTFLSTRAFLTSLMPMLQPRTADAPSRLSPPRVAGRTTSDGPHAALIIEFDSANHLREHVMEAVSQTLDAGIDLRSSILQHGVSEEVIAVVATIVIADTSDEFTALVVRDGLTRTIYSFFTAFGGDTKANDLPSRIADTVLRSIGPTTGEYGESKARRKGREQAQSELHARFRAAASDTCDPDLVRFGQTATLPVKIVTGLRRFTGFPSADAATAVFPDAVSSAIAQIHTLSRPWTQTAISANTSSQAIQRLAAQEKIDSTVAAVALGMEEFRFDLIDAAGSPLLTRYGSDEEVPAISPALHRGVFLLATLSGADVFAATKSELRALRSDPQIHKRRYAGLIQSLITRPWALTKQTSFGNGQKAWTAGGPLPHDLYGTDWTPLAPVRYADLVPVACDPASALNVDARATLQAAGGIALIADGVLIAASGSTEVGAAGVRFARSQPNRVVEKLGESEMGLWVLAHAADSFQADLQAVNSFSDSQSAKIPADTYKLAYPEQDDPSKSRLVSRHEPLYDLIRTAAGLRSGASVSKQVTANPPRTPGERAADLSIEILREVTLLVERVEELEEVSRQPGIDPYAKQEAVWDSTKDGIFRLTALIQGLKPGDSDEAFLLDDDGELDDESSDTFDVVSGDDEDPT
ncbi:hypothetical protein [Nocardia rhamnosiphila]